MDLSSMAFIVDLFLTLLVCFGVVLYIRGHLRPLVAELCGSATRAQFWVAFSNVTLVLVPAIFAMSAEPNLGSGKPLAFVMAEQLRLSLLGLALSLAALVLVLMSFIRRFQVGPAQQRER
jgi:hypothetical protein